MGDGDKLVRVYARVVEPENPNRARKRESFRMQREHRKARKEGNAVLPQLLMASVNEDAEANSIW